MGNQQFSLRKVFEVIANAIRPDLSWPESELPLIRHRPLSDDDEIEHWTELVYLEALADEIADRCAEGARLPDFPPVESQAFWRQWDWPSDQAALMLAAWRQEQAA